MEAFLPRQICATYAGSLAAGRITYAPMQLKVCRAALFADACGDLASRKAGQMLADCALYAGTVAAAGQCATDKDCAGGWCDTNAGCLGTCRAFVPESGACSGTDVCAPGTACNGTACVSASGQCGDGVDNDGDGKNGYPFDPGCSSITDPTELDDCPLGSGCAACANQVDEDGDGAAGYPTDPGCASPGDLDESDGCPDPFNCPECSNNYDDDDDGDYDEDDSACSSAAWNDERPES
jgi:hypothetical protein